ncbi:MAG: phospholipid carrier-dependent glycosyltransferase, partial [Chitinophagales bacterium]
MANKKNKGNIPKPAQKASVPPVHKEATAQKASTNFNLVEWFKTNPYAPGIVMFAIAFIIGLVIYKDYGICWDEPFQRGPGLLSYDFIFNGNEDLFNKSTDNHGAGFELLLVMIEKWLNLTDTKAIYEMRHLVTHVVFLAGAFAGYVLAYRLFKNKFIASLGFIMLVFAPRLYAHSFFNSKDIPFLSMFLVTLAICQAAFEQNKKWLFAILGLACGYATSIRIMGIMLACFIGLFLVIDLITAYTKKEEKPNKTILNLLFFTVGFCFTVYIAWPYLWKDPVHNFVDSFTKLSHFNLWTGIMLLGGKYISSMNLPWTYFPTWFLISNPI